MIKKVISLLSVLLMLLFISCASSQPEADNSKNEKPNVEAPVVETPDNSKADDTNTSATEEEKSGDKASENTELAENPDELEESEDTSDTETEEDTQPTTDTQTEEGQETEASENNIEDSSDSAQADDTENNTNTSITTDTEVSSNSSEQNTELTESENEENVDETAVADDADDNNEAADDEANEFADLEIPEDFEEPLVRDLYLAETEDDSENTEDEENPDDSLEQNGEDENSELAENSEEADEIIEEPEPEEIIIPSRSVTLRKGENLAIIYPGSGWIYMGSLSEYNNMASKGRKLGSQDTKYTLLAKEAGTQIHHFYKIDNLTGDYIDDYIEITVLDKKGSSKTTITAPAYVEVVPQKPETPAKESKPAPEPKSDEEQMEETSQTTQTRKSERKEEKPAPVSTTSSTTSTSATTSSTTSTATTVSDEADLPLLLDETNSEDDVINVEEDEIFATQEEQPQINTDEILEKAKSAFDEKRYEESFTLLTEFFEYAIDRQDEALYLQGQLLEADSSIKDIKGAVQAYELLTKNYPSSIYWNDANKRIKYLRRFYYLSN